MATLSRWLRRWEAVRIAAAVLGVAWIALAGAYVFGAASGGFVAGSAIAAAAALAIVAAGFLYAWREPASVGR